MSCADNSQILSMKRNDTLPKPKGKVVQTDPDNPGQPVNVDITGATIKFVMVTNDDTRTEKVNAAASITNGAAGEFEYSWVAGDTDTSGDYLGEFEIAFPLGGKITLPSDDSFLIRIKDDYDNA